MDRTTPALRRVVRLRAVVGFAAIIGTLPYLTVKLLWLTGSTVGVTDATFAADPSIHLLNLATAGMDLVAILVALAFTLDWGRRLPAWLVLGPIWVGTGFLAPIAVGLPVIGAGLLVHPENTTGTLPLEAWVQPMVYGGFAWQGVTLLTAFVLYAKVRWASVFTGTVGAHRPGATHAVQVLVARAGAMLAVLVAAGQLYRAFGGVAGPLSGHLVDGVLGILALAGFVGVLTIVERWRPGGRFWPPVVAGWIGAGAMFSWGAWGLVNELGSTVLSAGASPLVGFLDLAKVLAAVLLAAAALMVLAERYRGAERR